MIGHFLARRPDGGRGRFDCGHPFEATPDPLAAQVVAYEARRDAQTVTPLRLPRGPDRGMTGQRKARCGALLTFGSICR